MDVTPVPQGALGRIPDGPGLLGRLLNTQQSKHVPKSPENEMSVKLSPENEDAR